MPTPLTKQTIPIGPTKPSREAHAEGSHWAAWQAHVDAGRIGKQTAMSPEVRRQLARNEMILCGYRVLPNYDSPDAAAGPRFYRGFLEG